VVPHVPFPNDFTAGRSCFIDLDEEIRVEETGDGCGVASCGDGLVTCFYFLHNHEDVAVGERYDIVAGVGSVSCIVVLPEDGAIPCDLLKPTIARRDAIENRAVVKHIGVEIGCIRARPGVIDDPGFIDEVTRHAVDW